jgi:hypothetical protein
LRPLLGLKALNQTPSTPGRTSSGPSLITYKASVTMIGTFNDDLSTLEIWFFAVFRTKLRCRSLTYDGRDPSSCIGLQDKSRMAYSTPMARRSQAPRISSIYDVFIHCQLRHLQMATYDLSWPDHGTDHPHVKDLVITSFRPTVTFLHGDM